MNVTKEFLEKVRGLQTGDWLQVDRMLETDDELRSMWRAAGGEFYGPHIETGTMPEAKLLPFLRSLLLAAAPTPPAQDDASVDEIITRLYRRFKRWSKQGFGPEDVTWCEVKADVMTLMREFTPPAPEVEPVAWGVPNSRPCAGEHPLMQVMLDNTGCQYPQLLVPLFAHADKALIRFYKEAHRLEKEESAELRKAIKSITESLRNREWAEHVSSDPDVAELEAQITALVGEVSGLRKAAQSALEMLAVIRSENPSWRLAIDGTMNTLRAELDKVKS